VKIERKLIKDGYFLIAGVDEVGRGALAGPVVACAVLFDKDLLEHAKKLFGKEVNDSKLLSPAQREKLYRKIRKLAPTSIGKVSNKKIDKINILEATKLAMRKAILSLPSRPDIVLVDGNLKLNLDIPQLQIIDGDRLCFSISCASIVAKVVRDRIMERLHYLYSQYNFKRNKGYGTKEHIESLYLYGPSPIHRRSFSPVRQALEAFEKGKIRKGS
jgi:ribonuclease HII